MGDTADRAQLPRRDTKPLPGWPRGLGEELAAAYIGLSVSSVRRLRAAGGFPRPVMLTPGRLVWLRDARAGTARPLTGNILDDLPDA